MNYANTKIAQHALRKCRLWVFKLLKLGTAEEEDTPHGYCTSVINVIIAKTWHVDVGLMLFFVHLNSQIQWRVGPAAQECTEFVSCLQMLLYIRWALTTTWTAITLILLLCMAAAFILPAAMLHWRTYGQFIAYKIARKKAIHSHPSRLIKHAVGGWPSCLTTFCELCVYDILPVASEKSVKIWVNFCTQHNDVYVCVTTSSNVANVGKMNSCLLFPR